MCIHQLSFTCLNSIVKIETCEPDLWIILLKRDIRKLVVFISYLNVAYIFYRLRRLVCNSILLCWDCAYLVDFQNKILNNSYLLLPSQSDQPVHPLLEQLLSGFEGIFTFRFLPVSFHQFTYASRFFNFNLCTIALASL